MLKTIKTINFEMSEPNLGTPKKKKNEQLWYFDFTIPELNKDGENINKDDMCRRLSEVFNIRKTYLQHEESVNGYRHFQGRGSTLKQYREGEMKKAFQKIGIFGIHGSPTSNANKENFDYVTKDFTKLEWCGFLETFKKEKKTWQMEIFTKWELRGFQKTILEEMKIPEMNKINIFLDETGMIGKSLFVEFACWSGSAFQVPPYMDMEKMMGFIMSFREYKNYFIDMPRGLKGQNLNQFMSGIECLKNGFVYDGRNKGRFRRQSRPNIFLFCNDVPNLGLLTLKRWKIRRINSKFELKKVPLKEIVDMRKKEKLDIIA